MKKTSGRDFQNMGQLRLFLSYYKPHLTLFTVDMVCALVICLIDLSFPYASRYVMQHLIPESAYSVFFIIMGICAAAFVLKGFLYYIVIYWGHLFGVRVEADMRRDVFGHMQKLSFSFFDKNRTGALMSRITNDLFEISELAHHGPEDLFISTLTLLGAFAVMCTIQWKLALVIIVAVPLSLIFVILQRANMRRVNLAVKAKTAEINATTESGISGMRTAKAFNNEDREYEKFSATNSVFVRAKQGFYKQMAIFNSGMEFVMSVMPVLVVAAGGALIMQGDVDYADLVAFMLYVTTFITPIRKLSGFFEQYMQGMAGFHRFMELMRTRPDVSDAPDAGELGRIRGDITFENVTFSYGGDVPVVRNIDLTIRTGEKIALVGPSGGGKTTLCQLLLRFYDVTEGRILADGQDIRAVTQRSLRENIGIVQQDVFIFADTVRENIRYGRPEATDGEVEEAARRAEIHGDILQMPDGYDTYVGERGTMLSGGQKQRLSIARLFLKNPPVVVLDEATSALDSITESRIQESFDQLCEGRTSVVIAHRLSTVRNADRIAVVDGGRIVELGTHAELVQRGGEYARLISAQERIAQG